VFVVKDRFGNFGFEEDADFDLAKPLRPAIHRLMIQGMAKDGKYDEALKLADRLVEANDTWRERQLRGWVLREAGKFPEAIKVYEDAQDRIAKDEGLTDKGKEVYGDRNRQILSNLFIESKQIDKGAEILKGLIDRHP